MTIILKRVIIWTFSVSVFCLLISGKKTEPLYIETSTQIIDAGETNSGKDVMLQCILAPEVAKKLTSSEVEFHFYAKNNIKNIPFELTDQSFQAFKTKATPIAGRRSLVFETSWDMLFYKASNSSPYRWQWTGKAEPPLSPLADIGDQHVKEIQCWFTVHINGKKYKSERLTYEVKP